MIDHGGTDAGPPARIDLSTNANPYGPSPMARAALQVDVGPYPDPTASSARATLADHHGCASDQVVVGAGATELIDRLVRVVGGPVLTASATFGEYAGAAARHGVATVRGDGDAFLERMGEAALAFACSPGNPDGQVLGAGWCDEVAQRAAATGTVVVWDLAYAPMVAEPVPVPAGAVALHAPNKAHGCTGLRAGWLRAPAALADQLRAAAVTWTVSTPGLAFLAGTASAEADRWVARTCATLRADRDALAAELRALDLEVVHGAAPFVLVAVPDGIDGPTAVRLLREEHGIKVRPTDSMGLPGHWRLAAVPTVGDDLPVVVAALTATLDRAAPQLQRERSER